MIKRLIVTVKTKLGRNLSRVFNENNEIVLNYRFGADNLDTPRTALSYRHSEL